MSEAVPLFSGRMLEGFPGSVHIDVGRPVQGDRLMSGGDPSGVLRDIRTLFSNGMLGGLTDRQLLERFVNRNDPRRRMRSPSSSSGTGRWSGAFVVACCLTEPPRPTRFRRRSWCWCAGQGGQGRRLAGAVALRRQPPRRRTGAGRLPAPAGAGDRRGRGGGRPGV